MTLDDKEVVWGQYSLVCSSCVHYQGDYKCAAFDEIPRVIWFGENDHREPYPGDNGIQYEPVKEQ